jgi:hypothetical protein
VTGRVGEIWSSKRCARVASISRSALMRTSAAVARSTTSSLVNASPPRVLSRRANSWTLIICSLIVGLLVIHRNPARVSGSCARRAAIAADCRWRQLRPLRWADGRMLLAVDVCNWLRPDAATSAQRLFCHTYGCGKGQAQMIPAGRTRSSPPSNPAARHGPRSSTLSGSARPTTPPPSPPPRSATYLLP